MAEREPLLNPLEAAQEIQIGDERDGQGADSPAGDSELEELKSNAILKAQGHKAELERSFSTLAALGLGFRYVGSHSNSGRS